MICVWLYFTWHILLVNTLDVRKSMVRITQNWHAVTLLCAFPLAYLILFQSIFIAIVLEMQFPQLTACKWQLVKVSFILCLCLPSNPFCKDAYRTTLCMSLSNTCFFFYYSNSTAIITLWTQSFLRTYQSLNYTMNSLPIIKLTHPSPFHNSSPSILILNKMHPFHYLIPNLFQINFNIHIPYTTSYSKWDLHSRLSD